MRQRAQLTVICALPPGRALALADLGACLRRAGRVAQARYPLRRALDLAERTGSPRCATTPAASSPLQASGPATLASSVPTS
jgi:hypothetical protein